MLTNQLFAVIEAEMLKHMNDGAHDKDHIYRVLYYAVTIAKEYTVDMDVLIAASLLHDIGREAQFKDSRVNHALYGAEMAYTFLLTLGWDSNKAEHVKQCIATHRFRKEAAPESIEAKILFDSDKLDVCGTVGIARTLAYKGIVAEPLYSVDVNGNVLNGAADTEPSFFQEYQYKLKNIYTSFYTPRAKEIASGRKEIAERFYECMLNEVTETYRKGQEGLKQVIVD